MIATWMLYGIATSLLLVVAALAADRAARLLRWPLRWTWIACLWGSVLGPAALMYSARGVRAPGRAEQAVRTPRTNTAEPARIVTPPPATRRGAFSFDALDRPLLVGWLVASLAVSTALLIGLLSLARARRRWHAAIVSGARVLISPDVGPAVGLFGRDPIVLPEWALAVEPELQRLMLLHEQEHVRARDPQVLIQALVPLVLFPWNLPLWWQVQRLRLAIEMDCDARVLQHEADVAAYGELLFEVGRRAIRRARMPMAAFSEGRTSLEARIRMMTSNRPRHYLPLAVALAVTGALALVATGAIPRPALRLSYFAAPWLVAPAPQDTGSQATLSAMRSSLRNLVIAQEQYYADHTTYTADLGNVYFVDHGASAPNPVTRTPYEPASGVSVALLRAGTSGWTGKATVQGYRGSCVIYVGWVTRREDWPATDLEQKTGEEGAPACDGDGQPATPDWATYVRDVIAFALRQIALTEEHEAGATGRYGPESSREWRTRFEGLKLEFLWADSASFALKATLPTAFPGKSCVVWSGRPWLAHRQRPATDAERRTAWRGEAACDRF